MKSILCSVGCLLAATVGNLLLPVALATDMDDDFVTCGSAIKLTSKEGRGSHYLSSGQHKINTGSNQQLVTASPKRSESDLLWLISAGHGTPECEPGTKIPYGSKIRFTHMNTGSNLHSHMYKSPLTSNQEVTGFGDGGSGDAGDNWKVNPVKSGSGYNWLREQTVILTHVDTGKNLGTASNAVFSRSNCGSRCPVMDHQEVYAMNGSPQQVQWKAELGVYLSL